MSGNILESLQHPIQQVSGAFAVSLNTLLLYLITYHSPKSLGAYRYLIMYTSIFEILYAFIDLIAEPVTDKLIRADYINFLQVLYSKDSALLAILDSSRSEVPIKVLFFLNVIFCGSFGTSMAIFGIHFVFRYLVIKG